MDQVALRLAAAQALGALGVRYETPADAEKGIEGFVRYLTSALNLGPQLAVASNVAPFPGGAA